MYPSTSQSSRPHYGLAVYSRLPVLQSCQPVSLANSCGTVECTLVQVAVQPSVILSVVSVYRRPASDLNHFTTAMSHLLEQLGAYQADQSDVTHHILIMGDFNIDCLHQSARSIQKMTAVFPGYRQLVCISL